MNGLDFLIMDKVGVLIGALACVGIREYVKALASTKFYDLTPKKEGRLTLNPFKHTDLLGLIFFLAWGYGWSKPVNTNAYHYPDRKKNTLIVYLLPLLTNILFGLAMGACAVLVDAAPKHVTAGGVAEPVSQALYWIGNTFQRIAFINVSFGLFSLIPVYPLDGAKLLNLFLKAHQIINLQRYEKVMQILLVFFIILGLAGSIFDPLANALLVWAV